MVTGTSENSAPVAVRQLKTVHLSQSDNVQRPRGSKADRGGAINLNMSLSGKLPFRHVICHCVNSPGADGIQILHQSNHVENDTNDEEAEDDNDRGNFLLEQIHAQEGKQQSCKSGNQRVPCRKHTARSRS